MLPVAYPFHCKYCFPALLIAHYVLMTTTGWENRLLLCFNFSELLSSRSPLRQTGSTLAAANPGTQPRGKVAATPSGRHYSGRRHHLTLSAAIVPARLATASACPAAGTASRRPRLRLMRAGKLVRLYLLLLHHDTALYKQIYR